jgi:hypothetical protein
VNAKLRIVALGLMVCFLTLIPALGDDIYVPESAWTGSRSAGNGITATGSWADTFQVSWAIVQQGSNWQYTYTFSGATSPDLSHWILELSSGFTSADIWGIQVNGASFSDVEIKNWDSQQGNQGMPGTVFGIKFDTGGITFSFDTNRAPVWGDFFAKGGQESAWNNGFGTAPTESSNFNHYIARPDTRTSVPEPGTLLLLGAGLLATACFRRR